MLDPIEKKAQNLVIFNVKVIFGERELLAPVDLSKSSIVKFVNG